MSFELPTQRKAFGSRPRWSGSAFLVEAMLLLVFVMASLAVLTQLFAAAAERAGESRALTDAVAAASSAAERFAADPAGIAPEFEVDGMRVTCDVRTEPHAGGTMYHATISVFAGDEAGSAAGAGAGAAGAGAAAASGGAVAVPVDARASGQAAPVAQAAPAAQDGSDAAVPAVTVTRGAIYAITTSKYQSGA